uniref:LysR substrate-binding domain-containing protein n=1 Tax=Flavobacterium sp. TaxID=239 RepID=UPI00404A645D
KRSIVCRVPDPLSLNNKGQLFGKIKISVVSTGKYVMPYFLADFLKKHPGVELEMDVTNKNKVVESLQNNEVDFALVSILPDKMKVEKIDLMQNKLFLVGNRDEEFTAKSNIEKILENRPLLFRESGSGTRQTMERFIDNQDIKINKRMELTSNEAIKQAILAGIGYSIMPLIGIRKELQNNELQIIPLKGLPIKTDWSLIWVKGKNHNPAALAYLDYLKKEKEAIIHSKFSWYETM